MPKTEFTGIAHYHLGLILHNNKKNDKDDGEIKSHIELALNLGMDPTVSINITLTSRNCLQVQTSI